MKKKYFLTKAKTKGLFFLILLLSFIQFNCLADSEITADTEDIYNPLRDSILGSWAYTAPPSYYDSLTFFLDGHIEGKFHLNAVPEPVTGIYNNSYEINSPLRSLIILQVKQEDYTEIVDFRYYIKEITDTHFELQAITSNYVVRYKKVN